MTAVPRRVLVIATQCAAEQELDRLTETADTLYRLLTSPDLGACEPDERPGTRALRSGKAESGDIVTAVEEAALRAAEEGAVLVLAFLGHGHTPPASPHLFYLAHDGVPGQRSGSVDVGHLLTAAADRNGIRGVIALIDTCHAGAAALDLGDLAAGFTQGHNRLSVLMASAAHQKAYDLDFSRTLADIVVEGLPDAAALLDAVTLKPALAGRLLRQDTNVLGRDGDPDATEDLWITRNARHRAPRPGGPRLLGAVGEQDLARALAACRPDRPRPAGGWTRDALRELYDEAVAVEEGLWAADVAAQLIRAADTVDAVQAWAGDSLTRAGLWRAAAELGREGGAPGTRPSEPLRPPEGLNTLELLRHIVEFAALRMSRLDTGATEPLVHAVAAVGAHCGLDPDGPRIRQWAGAQGWSAELREAQRSREPRPHTAGRRLVVSLHAARTDWPESLSVWLIEGQGPAERREVACEPTQTGVENTLAAIVQWADGEAPEAAPVGHVDIAVPTGLLTTWQPENARVGLHLLGHRRTVVLRWACRLAVPGHLAGMNELALSQLDELAESHCGPQAPVDWLGPAATHDVGVLAERLAAGAYGRAIGFDHRPAHLTGLLETVLPYSPIVLWPHRGDGSADHRRSCLDQWWGRLPAEFTAAYVHRRRRELDAAGPDPAREQLAELRAAWHDRQWLEFCRRLAPNRPQTPTIQWST